jgi:cytochrome P450
LFVTGSETLGGALSYALLFMALHPEVQKQVHREIDSVISRDEEVEISHKERYE